MNLDELRSVQSKERSKDSLQHLRESFYADVGEYIRSLREERERAAERADDPFDSAEVNRLTDEIKTAEEVVEAVYERRVGKVVKRASLAAAGMTADEEGLTTEEQQLFADLVARIETNKTEVLDVLAGESSDSAGESGSETTVDAADASAAADVAPASEPSGADSETEPGAGEPRGGQPETSEPASAEPTAPEQGSRPTDEAAAVAGDGPRDSSKSADSAESSRDDSADSTNSADADSEAERDVLSELDERTTVRITSDVGEILGVDEREYDLAAEDVVTLPAANAEPLVERDAAEKLE